MNSSKTEDTTASVIVPALNESNSIETILRDIQKLNEVREVIVVDGGSIDGTPEIAEKMHARVHVQSPVERGWGSAVLTGIRLAQANNIVIIDADATYDPADIPKLLHVLASDPGIGIVVGKRVYQNTTASLGARLLNFLFRILFGKSIDITSTFLAARKNLIEQCDLRSSGFDFSIELMATFAKKGMRIAEVPVSYCTRIGKRKLRVLPYGIHYVNDMLRERT